ncbi:LURP-one-related/scramblase family protein [Streptomyces polyrhachis]|uniref:LURP-one-related/scramblase family protein n=1 Tax=Streptomyces polyrhachis TaxID=1282885 RepID=A0ABW2GK01_9ACTN
MTMLQERRDRRNANRAFEQGAGVSRYRLQQKMIAVGDDYWIDDEAGEHRYKVDGKVLRARRTYHLEEPDGQRVATVRSCPLRLRDSMAIEDADGNRTALVKKALIDLLRDRWRITLADGTDLRVHGRILDHEYAIERDGYKLAQVSKKWFRLRDTYGLDIGPDTDPVLMLAAVVALDAMTHPGT